MTAKKLRTAVLVSGRGSNLRALLDAHAAGKLPMVEFSVVFSNSPDAPALDAARAHGIPAAAVDHRPFLAGYMRILSPHFISAYSNRIINIHPSLLPAFPGVHSQHQALDYGTKVAGCTVHFVNEQMDAGAIILQRTVPVRDYDDGDMLAARILKEEHRALPCALDLASRGRLRIVGRRVVTLPGAGSYPDIEDPEPRYPVIIATGNAHKVMEIRQILADSRLSVLPASLLPPIDEPEESADDYLGNALIKAKAWRDHSGLWTLADDSGLEVDALDGRPGVHSSRYAPTNNERIQRLLAELEGVPDEKRTARFVCTAVLCTPAGEHYHARGTCEGRIAHAPRGDGGFGYDPIFLPDGFDGATLAELGEDIKNGISHRARAMKALQPILDQLQTGNLP
jgi:non-canonical purine NTP pyrophosphatase (RdgB/HAM1 family)